MAILYVTEFSQFGMDPNTGEALARMPPMAEQTVAIGAGSLQSNPFNAATRFIRLHTDVVCCIEIGTNPTAVGSTGGSPTARFAANQTEYFAVNAGDRVAVITSA